MMEKVTTETKSVIEDNNNIESFFEEILHTSPVVASGRDGIILKVDMSNFNSSLIEKINNKEIKISIGAYRFNSLAPLAGISSSVCIQQTKTCPELEEKLPDLCIEDGVQEKSVDT